MTNFPFTLAESFESLSASLSQFLALAIDTTRLEGINLRNPGGENLNTRLNDLTLDNSLIDSPLGAKRSSHPQW